MIFSGKAILFDLDGTLVDTAPDLVGTLNDLLTARRLPPIGLAEVRSLIGHGAKALIEKGFAGQGRALDKAEADALFDEYITIYEGRIARESLPFPGAQETLSHLAGEGAGLAVVTNKLEGLSRQLLDALALTSSFGSIIGFDTAPRPKPHADPILLAARQLGIRPEDALMVGDSITDVGAARAAGIPVIVMRHGYTPIPADELGADIVIDGFAELLPALRALSR